MFYLFILMLIIFGTLVLTGIIFPFIISTDQFSALSIIGIFCCLLFIIGWIMMAIGGHLLEKYEIRKKKLKIKGKI